MVRQFRFIAFSSLIFSFYSGHIFAQEPSHVENVNSVTQEVKVTYSDKVALKVAKKVYFLSEVNQVIDDLSKVRCLKQSLLLESIGYRRDQVNHIDKIPTVAQESNLKKVSLYLMTLNHVQALGINSTSVKECKGKHLSNQNIQNFLLVESYLRSRFVTQEGLDERGLKVFLDTTFQKVFYEQLL